MVFEMLVLLLTVISLFLLSLFFDLGFNFLLLLGKIAEIEEERHGRGVSLHIWRILGLDFIVVGEGHPPTDIGEPILWNSILSIRNGIQDVISSDSQLDCFLSRHLFQFFTIVFLEDANLGMEGDGFTVSAGADFTNIVVPDVGLGAVVVRTEQELVIRSESMPDETATLRQLIFLVELVVHDVPDADETRLVT